MTSYYSLLNKIEAFCDAHLQIKKFAGEFREQMPNFCTLDEKYPVVFVVPNGSLPTLNQKEFTIDIYCVDVIQKDRANLNVILSDTELILNDIYLYFSDGPDLSIEILSSPTLTPVNNFDLDYVAGWFMTVTFQVEGYCVEAIPIKPIEPGGGACPDAKVTNSSESYQANIPSGDIITLPDINIRVLDELGNILSNADYPSVENQTITVDCPDCLDGLMKIKKEGDGSIANIPVPCGTTVEYDVADNDISVNGSFIVGIDATDPLDVKLFDSNSNTITPQNVTYHGNTHHLDIKIDTDALIPVGAQLMKTGQTTSYRTGDDGDLEAGRPSTFLTLSKNNPFGNTNRFTDTLGGQTYTDNIVIDWSTFDGSSVLGISKNLTLTGNILWDAAIDYCLTFSAGAYTTGWRLWNYKEFANFLDLSKQHLFQFAPFNNNQILNYWFSNTLATSATTAWVASGGNAGTIGIALKNGASGRALPVRTFGWNGTNLI